MNRTSLAWAIAYTMLLVPGSSQAAQAGSVEAGAGFTKGFAEWGGRRALPGGPGISIAYWRSVSADLSWGLEAAYDDLGGIEFTYADPFSSTTGRTELDGNVLRINPAFRARFGPPRGPGFLVHVGAGFYHVSWTYRNENVFIFEGEESDNNIGISAGAGVALPLGSTRRVILMGAYHFVEGDNDFTDNFNHLQGRAAVGFDL